MKDKKVEFQDKVVHFNEGDQIITAIAYKHDIDDLKSYFNIYFDEASMVQSEDGSQVFVLCKK